MREQIRRSLDSIDSSIRIYEEMIIICKSKRSTLKMQLEAEANKEIARVGGLLELVTGDFSRTENETSRLRRMLPSWDRRRCNKAEIFEQTMDLSARAEVSYLPGERIYIMRVFKDGRLHDEKKIPKYKRWHIRANLSRKADIKIPWAQIEKGCTWSSEVTLSGLYVYDSMKPNNLRLLDEYRFKRVTGKDSVKRLRSYLRDTEP